MQAFECHGLWTLPGDDGPPVAGTLRVFSSGELRLSVIGTLGAPKSLGQMKEYPVILGSVDGPLGHDVTLTGCYVTRATFGSSDAMREEYRAQRGFFGAHLNGPDDFVFRRMELQIGGLGAWAHSLSGFRPSEQGGRSVGGESPLLLYAMPASVGGPIQGGEISIGLRLTSSSDWQKYTFAEQARLIVTFDPPLSDEEINQRFIYPLQNLITFACDRPQEVREIVLHREDVLFSVHDNPEIRLIVGRVFPGADDENTESIYPHELLFTLADIDGEVAPFIERWLRLTRVYADACNIYFGMQYAPPAYVDTNFLGMIESLALYYTRRQDGVAQRDEEARRYTELLTKLSPGDAEWIRRHIWVRPFPPLQDTLAKLLKEHADLMNPLLRTEQQRFINEVMNTAHYIIKRDPELGFAVSRGGDLYWMMVRLRMLMKLCILGEMGVPTEKARSFVAKNAVYQHLCTMA
jgi:hypothetical protein